MSDPFAVLGLTAQASLAEVRAARRRLALVCHPDHGGSEEEMKVLNAAFDAAVAQVTGRRRLTRTPTRTGGGVVRPKGGRRQVEHDAPSFTIDALPVEAYEALLVVTSWIGEVLVDEPPYLLEAHLYEPDHCWCRLDVVPDAGGSTVSLTVASIGGTPVPDVEAVRDTWVAHLNQLGRWPG